MIHNDTPYYHVIDIVIGMNNFIPAFIWDKLDVIKFFIHQITNITPYYPNS